MYFTRWQLLGDVTKLESITVNFLWRCMSTTINIGSALTKLSKNKGSVCSNHTVCTQPSSTRLHPALTCASVSIFLKLPPISWSVLLTIAPGRFPSVLWSHSCSVVLCCHRLFSLSIQTNSTSFCQSNYGSRSVFVPCWFCPHIIAILKSINRLKSW